MICPFAHYLKKVTEVAEQLLSGWVTEVDEDHSKFLKTMSVIGLFWYASHPGWELPLCLLCCNCNIISRFFFLTKKALYDKVLSWKIVCFVTVCH